MTSQHPKMVVRVAFHEHGQASVTMNSCKRKQQLPMLARNPLVLMGQFWKPAANRCVIHQFLYVNRCTIIEKKRNQYCFFFT